MLLIMALRLFITLKGRMNQISISSNLGNKIQAVLHDILCFTDRTDIVLISTVGSWGDTLENDEVFKDIKNWLIVTLNLTKEDEPEVFNTFYNENNPNASIVKLLLFVFTCLEHKRKMVLKALNLWMQGGSEKEVLGLLEEHLTGLLKDLQTVVDTHGAVNRKHETPEHLRYLLKFYLHKRNI